MPRFQSLNRSTAKKTHTHPHSVLTWDLPTRIFHWLLVALVGVSFVSGHIGGLAMQYHEWCGAAILVLVVFRLLWGFWGGQQSRFAVFVRGPSAVADYAHSMIRMNAKPYLGHNPLGGWSILAMLIVLSVQVGTGLFANDDIFTEGPLYKLVSKETSDWLTHIHHLNQGVLAVLIGVHVSAVLFHLIVKRENLITPMVTGYKHWHEADRASPGSTLKAFFLVSILAAAAYLLLY